MAEGTQLTNNVTSGVAWSVAEKIGSALLQAVVSIVVANAIMPMDMGIMAVLTVFTTLAQVVVDSGFSQTLIRKAAPTAEEYRAVFRFNILSSLILYALLSIVSPAIARYYGWPLLATVAPVLFLLLPLNALCVIQNTIMVNIIIPKKYAKTTVFEIFLTVSCKNIRLEFTNQFCNAAQYFIIFIEHFVIRKYGGDCFCVGRHH